jgi:hypothetical protein
MAREKASEQPQRTIRVLSASDDLGLSRSRVLLLQQFGYDAMYSESKEHARDLIENTGIDVLIFGSALTRDTCWELAGVFRARNSKGKIVEVLPAPWSAPKNRPDATVVGSDEAEHLDDTIRSLLA